MIRSILPYGREGAWTISHHFYYDCAYRTFEDFQLTLLQLLNKEQELRTQYSDIDDSYINGFIRYETRDLHGQAFRQATTSFLFLCMTLEAFINHYGTKRLGERYYKINLERIGITEKLSLLVAVCHQTTLDAKHPLLQKIRTLFDKRNKLVHPKTREFDSERPESFKSKHPREIGLQAYFDDLEFIIEEICKLDPDVDRSTEFRKPGGD